MLWNVSSVARSTQKGRNSLVPLLLEVLDIVASLSSRRRRAVSSGKWGTSMELGRRERRRKEEVGLPTSSIRIISLCSSPSLAVSLQSGAAALTEPLQGGVVGAEEDLRLRVTMYCSVLQSYTDKVGGERGREGRGGRGGRGEEG